VIFLLIIQGIDGDAVSEGIVGDARLQPWTIIIIFFTLAYLCVSYSFIIRKLTEKDIS
jgi:hypothetical protein